jgi:predicted MFS family arabinose efflux permease
MGGVALYSTFANIVVGRRIPAPVRATTFAVLQATVFIAISTGAVAGGALSDLFSPQVAAAAAAATAAIAALLGLVTLARLGRSTQAKRTMVPG